MSAGKPGIASCAAAWIIGQYAFWVIPMFSNAPSVLFMPMQLSPLLLARAMLALRPRM